MDAHVLSEYPWFNLIPSFYRWRHSAQRGKKKTFNGNHWVHLEPTHPDIKSVLFPEGCQQWLVLPPPRACGRTWCIWLCHNAWVCCWHSWRGSGIPNILQLIEWSPHKESSTPSGNRALAGINPLKMGFLFPKETSSVTSLCYAYNTSHALGFL